MGLQGPADLMGTRAVAPGLTFPIGRRRGVGSLCSGPGPGEDCWFLKPGESPWLVFVWRILGQDLAHPLLSCLTSWFMGRRPEYTDPKVVAQGEGREGKAGFPNPTCHPTGRLQPGRD